ncbi:MAG: 3'-5' exonuclease domain-containing protein 2 [Paludibacteraceae bacterium]|nr:3'-5' exonuclease domain-containing protein 2 [Paludibacteraceae bacterium]
MELNRFEHTISKDAVNSLPVENYSGEIVVVNNLQQLDKCLSELYNEKIVGIDTETRPNFKKGAAPNKVALLQIATDRKAFLVRLNKTGMPNTLLHFLEDNSILKVGLSLKDDLHAIRIVSNIQDTSSLIDLQTVVKSFGIEEQSLQKIYAIVFGQKISKRQRLTNWEAPELTLLQQKYAALDAYACLKIYKELGTVK